MLRYIEKLQKQPEHIRKLTLFISVGVIMAVIALVWISTLGIRFSSTKDGVVGVKNEGDNKSSLPPLSVIKEQTSRFYDELVGNIDSIKKDFVK